MTHAREWIQTLALVAIGVALLGQRFIEDGVEPKPAFETRGWTPMAMGTSGFLMCH
ncbi:MAG: hypothetical protein KC656_24190 [Myxococcales bacterium]|nr:hypothetical protein [Myxococcales bacterium]MCB9694662.1 hypothetical protein [Alphaproteobacteria bacterium]